MYCKPKIPNKGVSQLNCVGDSIQIFWFPAIQLEKFPARKWKFVYRFRHKYTWWTSTKSQTFPRNIFRANRRKSTVRWLLPGLVRVPQMLDCNWFTLFNSSTPPPPPQPHYVLFCWYCNKNWKFKSKIAKNIVWFHRVWCYFDRNRSLIISILLVNDRNNFQYWPEPATPTVAAPAPMNLAAESMSRVTGEVWKDLICGSRATGVALWAAAKDWLWLITALLKGRKYCLVPLNNCKINKSSRKGYT